MAEADKNTVKGLLKASFLPTDWEWKYSRNPTFDAGLAAVVEKDGNIVGCNHWLPREIKLSRSSTVSAILSADFAIDPSHRKHGIGKSLLLFQRQSVLPNHRGAILNYMFTTTELGKRLFKPTANYIPVSTSTVTYSRRWSWRQFIRRVEEVSLNTEANTKGRNLKFVFYIPGAPPLTIALNQRRIEAFQGDVAEASLRVKGDLATLALLSKKEKRLRKLFKALLTGRIRVSGSLSGLIGLNQNLDLLREIFRFALY